MGAATVLSYAMIAEYFPRELAARANGALNLAHFGSAFAVQYGIGLVVGQWSSQDGQYPVIAYQLAFGLSAAFQAAALLWFAVPWLRMLSRHLYAPFTRPSEQEESRTEFVTVPIEGLILEPREATQW
jgi:MFS family permease